jgi:hypothetical protein
MYLFIVAVLIPILQPRVPATSRELNVHSSHDRLLRLPPACILPQPNLSKFTFAVETTSIISSRCFEAYSCLERLRGQLSSSSHRRLSSNCSNQFYGLRPNTFFQSALNCRPFSNCEIIQTVVCHRSW